jgi:predicted Zn-dependent protease with MMP-like domain
MRKRAARGDIGQLVEAAADAFEAGDLPGALAKATEACAADPRSVSAHHYRAAALAELGQLDEARDAYRRALALDPNDVDALLGAADLYINRLQEPDSDRERLEEGLELARRGVKRAGKLGDAALLGELTLLEGVALNQMGNCREALARLDDALKRLPNDVDAMLERGIALYELVRLDEAEAQLRAVLVQAPDEGWAHHYLGLVSERRGKPEEAERRFARARKVAPREFPKPVALSHAAFDGAVEEALTSLPEQVRRYLSNVAIAVEDIPTDDDLTAADPPLSPSILGVFRGTAYGQRGSMDPWSHFPSSIVLYQKNLQRFARDRKDLIEQIGITLIHEVGHFLGFDEDDLWERGLE